MQKKEETEINYDVESVEGQPLG
jgi:hypothetical protein